MKSKAKPALSGNSIKEAVDTLPVGLVFFRDIRDDGIPVLCNTRMYELVYGLTGKDLQLLSELREGLRTPRAGVEFMDWQGDVLYRFPDGTIWKFVETQIQTRERQCYTQVHSVEYTELFHRQKELADRNEDLRQMIDQVQRITVNIADITRQQEMLHARMRLHNKMGNCMLLVRQYAQQGCPGDKKEQFIRLWRKSLRDLREEVGAEDEPDALQMVVLAARNVGVEIAIDGEMPESKAAQNLIIAALRECVTNTKKHAEGTRLSVKIQSLEGGCEAVFTNDGRQPLEEIVEGGGLSSLREKADEVGAVMLIQSRPAFQLTLSMPGKSAEYLN